MPLLLAIERYLRAHHMPQTRFGRLAINDPRLVHDLRRGRQLRPETAERIARFLESAR